LTRDAPFTSLIVRCSALDREGSSDRVGYKNAAIENALSLLLREKSSTTPFSVPHATMFPQDDMQKVVVHPTPNACVDGNTREAAAPLELVTVEVESAALLVLPLPVAD
jgi:hypothetical protein